MRKNLTLLALLAACSSTPSHEEHAETEAAEHAEGHGDHEATEAPHAEGEDHEAHAAAAAETEPATPEGPSSYGEELSDRDLVALSTIAENPDQYAGQTVKTEGEIAAVCQQMGCWMEMRAEGVEPIRVPMAGHSFFLPKDVSGRHATIEGEVAVRELSADEREHLESEGALATAQALQISATGVVIR
ncbi:MAG: hypothetical protein CMN30_15775 [Sandaracinus sp.]|nr:hypothetical protein [Sandaracinus sp.]|tara:strand:+ start:442 stop:1005 length:564 start_codon:yes stop_codon:yes gene_type:complete